MQLTSTQLYAAIADLIAAGASFDPAAVFVGVFVSITDSGLDTLITDVVMPPTSVAVRKAVTAWGAPHSLLNGSVAVDGPAMSFSPASSADATTVAGWYIASLATAGVLLGFGYFPEPIALPDEFSEAGILLRLTLDPQGQWDANVYWNG